jgi:TfoX/Sxy family transcriptional regulator of competence genes
LAYCDGLLCAILDEDSLYLKANDASSEHFRQASQSSFSYQRKDGKRISMKFYPPR